MLESSTFATFHQDTPNQCLFEVKTKDPRLNLGLVSFIPTFELENDLESSLDLSANYATSTNEFEADFSLPSHRINDFVPPVNKLNVLPEKMDFSELLSFQSESSSIPKQPSIKEFSPPLEVSQMQSQLVVIPEEQQQQQQQQQTTEETPKIVDVDAIESQSMLLSKLGLSSEFFKNHSRSFIANAQQNAIKFRSQDDDKNNVSSEYLEMIKREMQKDCPETAFQGSILASYYYTFTKLLATNDNRKLFPLSETISNTCQCLNRNTLQEPQNRAIKENSLVVRNALPANEDHSPNAPKQVKTVEKSECNKEIAKKYTQNIVGANEIQEVGVQIFRKPTKLFTFDNLREWKKKGEGLIEIWKLEQVDDEIFYMLLWDKYTEKLLIHMRLDSKWSIDYLTNSTNSCRWSHYNYAQGPEGVRERFACRFRDSDVAAQFISIVGKCTGKAS